MPGVFGIVDRPGSGGLPDRLTRMLRRATHHPWYRVESRVEPATGVALGRLGLDVGPEGLQMFSDADGSILVMDGELYDAAQQRRALEAAGVRFAGTGHAELLLRGYQRCGRAFFAGLSGKFVAAVWDVPRGRLVAVNDRFGMRPLYFHADERRLLIASEIKSLLTDSTVPRGPNLRGLAQFFTFGQYLANDTSFESIQILPAAGWLAFEQEHASLSVDRYVVPGETKVDARTPEQWLERIDAAFKRAVDARTHDTPDLGIALSGGLDGRAILAVMDHDRAPIRSVALGIDGCADHKLAAQLAALVGCRHANHVLDTAFIADFEAYLDRMVSLTDGQYVSSCVVMPTLPLYRDMGIRVLLRGHVGELLHMTKAYNYSFDDSALTVRDDASLRHWAFSRLQAYMLDGVREPLLAGVGRDEFDEMARRSLDECLVESASVAPPLQRISHLFLAQRVRREITLSLAKFGSLVETRLPYLDNDLIEVVLAAPPELKLHEEAQEFILKRRRPEFLGVTNVNTGTRIGASHLVRRAAHFRQRVLAKLGARGHQPYERPGLWLRRELRPLVERTLLDDRCLDRGLLHPGTVRTVVREHLERRRNHTYLLLAMLVLERGQRLLVDEA
ncbi:MAG: hypothetical protein JW809_01950 [Pirellulales bacterium]|nr:hypothetical protein [Pirellulales bacterium]